MKFVETEGRILRFLWFTKYIICTVFTKQNTESWWQASEIVVSSIIGTCSQSILINMLESVGKDIITAVRLRKVG
jgi:hypothetical protein